MSELKRNHWYLQSDGTVQYLSETASIITVDDDGPIKLCGITVKDTQPLEVVKAGTVADLKSRVSELEDQINAILNNRKQQEES